MQRHTKRGKGIQTENLFLLRHAVKLEIGDFKNARSVAWPFLYGSPTSFAVVGKKGEETVDIRFWSCVPTRKMNVCATRKPASSRVSLAAGQSQSGISTSKFATLRTSVPAENLSKKLKSG